MTWVTCSQAGWGAGGSPGTRTSFSWLASKVICPCFLAASRIAKPEHIHWFKILVPKPHARVSQDIEPQPSTTNQNNAGLCPLGYPQLTLGMVLVIPSEHSFCTSAKVQLNIADMSGDSNARLHLHSSCCMLVATVPPPQPHFKLRCIWEGVWLCG